MAPAGILASRDVRSDRRPNRRETATGDALGTTDRRRWKPRRDPGHPRLARYTDSVASVARSRGAGARRYGASGLPRADLDERRAEGAAPGARRRERSRSGDAARAPASNRGNAGARGQLG